MRERYSWFHQHMEAIRPGTQLAFPQDMRATASSGVFVDPGHSLELRALPPARFRPPVRVSRRAVTSPARPVPRPSRRAMAIFTAALAFTSVGIAAWNAYWLAEPLRAALGNLLG